MSAISGYPLKEAMHNNKSLVLTEGNNTSARINFKHLIEGMDINHQQSLHHNKTEMKKT